MEANFIQRGEAVDFVPSYDVGAGEIIRFGALLGVVKIPVRTGEYGALHLSGIYDVVKAMKKSSPEAKSTGTKKRKSQPPMQPVIFTSALPPAILSPRQEKSELS